MTHAGISEQVPLSVRALEPGDVSSVVRLLRGALGDWPVVEGVEAAWDAEEFFDWKHRRSPFGASHVIVAIADGHIVGVRAFMPWRLTAGGGDIDALRSADAATRPELQRSGVFAQIRTVADEILPPGAQLGFGTPNRKSYGATMKLGGREVVEVIRPWVRVAVSRAAVAKASRRGAPPPVEAPRAAQKLTHDGPVAELLDEIRADEGRLTTARSVAYLRWRYGEAPIVYHALGDEAGGALRGLALFRMRTARGMPQAVIEELLVRPGDRRTAIRLLRSVGAATHAPLLCCRFPSPSAQRIAAATAGFLPRRDGLPLVVKRLTEDAPEIAGPQRWALTLGDVEIF
jgi:hypothetical protein